MSPRRFTGRAAASAISLCILLAGCRTGLQPTAVPAAAATTAIRGNVHGGQNPVSGSLIQLYAVGTTADGSAPTPLLTPAIPTLADGSFDIGGLFTCPTPSTLVYITATGGNPGLIPPVNNTAITLVSVLGQCGALSSSTFIEINEVTTVAAAAALAPFIAPPNAIGSSSADAAALASAFTEAISLADTGTGTSPGVGQSVDSTTNPSIPSPTINTLANVLSSCVNSTGSTASGMPCNKLFAATGSPANVFSSAANVEKNPSGYDTATIFALAPAGGPFQPQLMTAPTTFAIAPTPPSGSYSSASLTVTPDSGSAGDSVVIASKIGGIFTPPLQITIGSAQAAGSFTSTQITVIVPSGTGYGYVNGSIQTSTNTYPFTFYVPDPTALNLVSVGPSTLTFSAQLLATESTPQVVTITNNSAVAVQIDSTPITGGNNTSFNITSNGCVSAPLAPAASCTVSVAFDPAALGSLSSSLVVYINGMASPNTVALSGTGD